MSTVGKASRLFEINGLGVGVYPLSRFDWRGFPLTPALSPKGRGGALGGRWLPGAARVSPLAGGRGFHTPGPPWDIWGGKGHSLSERGFYSQTT
jgi:hypothetical protein